MVDQEKKQDILFDSVEFTETEGIKTLLGDPSKAIIKLSVPMIIGMSLLTLYYVVDAFWVAGLGAEAVAATGFVFPFFFFLMAISNGLGVGAGSAISRRIGAKDKSGANNVVAHTLILMLILSAVSSIFLFVFARDILIAIGAGSSVNMAVSYGQVIFAGSIFIFFSNIANAMLRGEGDAKRAMYVILLGSVLNIVLDPIFIYTLQMGVTGAAVATILSMAISSFLMLYWFLLKKDTFISFKLHGFTYHKPVIMEIFTIGFPASMVMLSMSITQLILNYLIATMINLDGVAVHNLGWRIASMAILPILGIATAVVSITGAAVGEKMYSKASDVHIYALKYGVMFEFIIALFTFIFAPQIAAVFTYAELSAHLETDLILFLRIMSLSYPIMTFGVISSSMFQGAGKGFPALVITVLRAIILTPLFVVLFATYFGLHLTGFWWGIVAANSIGPILAFTWARLYLRNLVNITT
jgi:putative MATE family efflux protein